MEQRPFVPPKPHDRPKPVLVQLDEASRDVESANEGLVLGMQGSYMP